MPLETDLELFRNGVSRVKAEIAKVIVGQDEIIDGIIVALIAGGHILLEGVPGLGKTLMVRTLASVVDLKFSRIQFTPDLMPADITGTTVLTLDESQARRFQFEPGPVFAQIVLADEINRATPKTQSALLEAMQEQSVTSGNIQHALPSPFCVLATQNPLEMEGTYPLPEAQLDRFMLKLIVPFPSASEISTILDRTTGGSAASVLKILDAAAILKMRSIARDVPIASNVRDFAVKLIEATHAGSDNTKDSPARFIRYGASPRAAQALVLAGKISALLDRRYNVAYEDIRKFAIPAMRHRIALSFDGEAEGLSVDLVLEQIIATVRSKMTVKLPA